MKKFVDSKKISDYEIETDNGFVDINFIHKTIPYIIWKIRTVNYSLECADTHIVFDENMNEIYVKDLKINDKIQSILGLEEIRSIEKTYISDNMYDLELPDNSNHRYYTNGILSHNTSLMKLLVADDDYLYINASEERGIGTVRDKIMGYCVTYSTKGTNASKYVLLDEFDGATNDFYQAFRAASEKYPHIKFIATCNYLNNLPDPIKSRFLILEFDPKNSEEEEELYSKYMKRVNMLSPKLGIEWENDEVLRMFIKKNFPDLRSIVRKLQDFRDSNCGTVTMDNIKTLNYTFNDIFNLAISKDIDTQKTYKTIMTEYSNKIDDVFLSLGTEFCDWIIENQPSLIKFIPKITLHTVNYQFLKTQIIDPPLALLALIFEIQNTIKG